MAFPGRRIVYFFALFLLVSGSLFAAELDSQRYLEHVKYLASEELRGRGTGTPELDKAAQYIAERFREFGLRPAGTSGFYQSFQVTTNARLGKGNSLSYSTPAGKGKAQFESGFVPLNLSSKGSVSGELVFAGYGITATEYGYDDYTHLDVKDKIVVLLRHEPQEFDEKSVFDGKVYTEHAQVSSKAVNAKMRGAKAVILVNDTNAHKGEEEKLEKFGRTAGPKNAGIPFVHVSSVVAAKWFAAAGQDLAEIQKGIDEDLKPRSFAFPPEVTVSISVDIEREQKSVNNVAGYLPGETDEYIVVGAHYDHLGLGEQFSMAPSQVGTPHYGADDNASGTAGVIELARYFAAQPKRSRGILFIAFAGEELGLLGSSHFANNPTFSLEKAVAMINMDMIGRIRNEKIYLAGTGTGSSFQDLLKETISGSSLVVDMADKSGYGASDHASFVSKQVPVLFFFSGLHGDYHRPSDTWDKINAPQAVEVLKLVSSITMRLQQEQQRPAFVKVAPPAGAHGMAGGAPGYGAWFGSVPDFGEIPTGVKFADVTAGSPAAKAGLLGGDILVEFDGKKVENLYDFTYALRTRKPGETVKVKVLRGEQPVEVSVTLERRR
jgi:hypothetical protein